VRVPARRTCIGCRRVRPKSELIRFVRGVDGTVMVDAQAMAAGRGAYACPTVECLEKALVTGRLGHALKGAVRAPRQSAAEIAEYWRRR
jgi:uncharacterized protein